MLPDGAPDGEPQVVLSAKGPPTMKVSGNGDWLAFSSYNENVFFVSTQGGPLKQLETEIYHHIPSNSGDFLYGVPWFNAMQPGPYPFYSIAVESGESKFIAEIPDVPNVSGFAQQPGAPDWIWSQYGEDDADLVTFRINVQTGELQDLCKLVDPDGYPVSADHYFALADDGKTFAVVSNSKVYVAKGM